MKARVRMELNWEVEGDSPSEIGGAVRNIQDSVRILRFSPTSGVTHKKDIFEVTSEYPVLLREMHTNGADAPKSSRKK